jgi:aryl-alcohol dehydrogenase-like predicted oxidoreductase
LARVQFVAGELHFEWDVAKAVTVRGGQAQIPLAWLRRNRIVAARIVGALKTKHIDDAIASLAVGF